MLVFSLDISVTMRLKLYDYIGTPDPQCLDVFMRAPT